MYQVLLHLLQHPLELGMVLYAATHLVLELLGLSQRLKKRDFGPKLPPNASRWARIRARLKVTLIIVALVASRLVFVIPVLYYGMPHSTSA